MWGRPRARAMFFAAKIAAIPACASVLYLVGLLEVLELQGNWLAVLAWGFIALFILTLVLGLLFIIRDVPKEISVQRKNSDVDPRSLY